MSKQLNAKVEINIDMNGWDGSCWADDLKDAFTIEIEELDKSVVFELDSKKLSEIALNIAKQAIEGYFMDSFAMITDDGILITSETIEEKILITFAETSLAVSPAMRDFLVRRLQEIKYTNLEIGELELEPIGEPD